MPSMKPLADLIGDSPGIRAVRETISRLLAHLEAPNVVPKTLDTGSMSSLQTALLVNLVLMSIFAVQHSGMARRSFKRCRQFRPRTGTSSSGHSSTRKSAETASWRRTTGRMKRCRARISQRESTAIDESWNATSSGTPS